MNFPRHDSPVAKAEWTTCNLHTVKSGVIMLSSACTCSGTPTRKFNGETGWLFGKPGKGGLCGSEGKFNF